MMHVATTLFKPLSFFSSMLSLSGVVHAAPDPSTQHYGNVQFGWSEAEETLIQSDSSFTPLENQKILDDSGNSAAIASKYAYCFGYKYDPSGNGSFDPTDPASDLKPDSESTLGNLLSEQKIDRDAKGNVIDSGAQCSPNNLGADNGEFGLHMILRWRLALSYSTTLDQLLGTQDPTDNNAAAPTTTSPTSGLIVGNVGESSDSVPCAANTKDLGTVASKYTGDLKQGSGPLTLRLCQLSSIGGSGDNTQGTSVSGGAVLGSRVAGAWQALGEKAKTAGVSLSSSSSFRLADSCGGTGNGSACAKPGQSLHQLGVAIDFATITVKGTSTTSCTGRGEQAGNASWDWLNNNAAAFGFKQYSFEAWHWDSLTTANRCGGDGTK